MRFGLRLPTFSLGSRTASLASLVGLFLTTVTFVVLYPIGAHLWAGAALIAVIVFRHEANINALLEKRENSFH